MIVVDASVAVDLLLGSGSEAGDTLADHLGAHDVVCAPHLLDAEVGQTLHRVVLSGDVPEELAMALVHDLAQPPIRWYPHTGLLARAFQVQGERDGVRRSVPGPG